MTDQIRRRDTALGAATKRSRPFRIIAVLVVVVIVLLFVWLALQTLD